MNSEYKAKLDLFHDNQKLAYALLWNHYEGFMLGELKQDLEQAALIGLWNGLQTYSEDADHTLGTHVRYYVQDEINEVLRHKGDISIPMDTQKKRKEHGYRFSSTWDETNVHDLMEGYCMKDEEKRKDLLDAIKKAKLTGVQREVMDLWLEDKGLTDISKIRGTSRQNSEILFGRAFEKIKKYLVSNSK